VGRHAAGRQRTEPRRGARVAGDAAGGVVRVIEACVDSASLQLQRLKLTSVRLLSSFAFNLKLRPYRKEKDRSSMKPTAAAKNAAMRSAAKGR